LAHRKGIIAVKCSELISEEGGKLVQGRLVFAKLVRFELGLRSSVD